MADRPFTVLVLCAGNSARSTFGEAILNRAGAGRFNTRIAAFSCLSIASLHRLGLQSKFHAIGTI